MGWLGTMNILIEYKNSRALNLTKYLLRKILRTIVITARQRVQNYLPNLMFETTPSFHCPNRHCSLW